MDAHDELLFVEGMCSQLGIVGMYGQEEIRKEDSRSRATPTDGGFSSTE